MSYADNWLKWFHVIERGASDLSAHLLEQARTDEAVRLLDVATGIGETETAVIDSLISPTPCAPAYRQSV
jgi:hypothetical protein